MGPMERAGHGGDCNNCGMAAASARESCVGILHWRVAGDRNSAWTHNSRVFAADLHQKEMEGKVEKLILWSCPKEKQQILRCEKLSKKSSKKAKKSVDNWVLVWYINRAPVEESGFSMEFERDFKKVEKSA